MILCPSPPAAAPSAKPWAWTAATRPPPPTRPSWPCVTGPLKTSPKTAVFGQRFFFVRRAGRRRTSGRMPRRERRGIFRKLGENGRFHVRLRQNAVCPGRIVYRNTCIHKCVKPCIFSRIWHKTVIFTLLLVVRESIMKTEFLHRFNIVFFKTGSVNLWNSSRPVWPGPWNPAISW